MKFIQTDSSSSLDVGEVKEVLLVDVSSEDVTSPDVTGYQFVDTDIPDRNIPTGLMFASVPSIAYNGNVVGLVYKGMAEGEGRKRIAYISLDETGGIAGVEKVILNDNGLESAIPLISSGSDGNFIFTTLVESRIDSIYLSILSEHGDILGASYVYQGDNLSDPLCGPVEVDGKIFISFTSFGDGTGKIIKVAYPSLELEKLLSISSEGSYVSPYISRSANNGLLYVFYEVDGSIRMEELNSDLELTHEFFPVELVRSNAVFNVASNSRGWVVFTALMGSVENVVNLRYHTMWGESAVADFPGSFFANNMIVIASDFPARAGILGIYFDRKWIIDVFAQGYIEEQDYGFSNLLAASDGTEDGRLEDMPWVSATWTEGGFLVVWDEWRREVGYGLFSSFIQVQRY